MSNCYSNKIRIEEIEKSKKEKKEQKKILNYVDNKKNSKYILRAYYDIIVICIILDDKKNEKNSNIIKFIKKETNGKVQELNTFKIIEINLFKEWDLIFRNQQVILFGMPISKDGQDWIKMDNFESIGNKR